MNILVMSQGLGGAIPWYRLTQSLRYLEKQGLVTPIFMDSRKDPVHITQRIKDADVIVMQCRTDWKALAYIQVVNKNFPEKLVVTEYDDNIFDIHPWNDKYKTLGQKEVSLTIDKKDGVLYDKYLKLAKEKGMDPVEHKDKLVSYLWKDGINGFNKDENIDRMNACAMTIEASDLLTITTKSLGEYMKNYSSRVGPIAVLPNLIDFNYWLPQKDNDTGKLRIAWQGGSSHYRDWRMCEDALVELQEHVDFTLVVAGQKFDGKLKQIKDIEFIPWHGDIRTYPLMMRNLKADIGIIPLEDNKFNRGKSALKWLEYSALKIPAIASDETPYKQVVKQGKTGLLVRNTKEEWLNAFLKLANDKKLRDSIADKAHKRVKAKWSLADNAMDWYEAYKQCLDAKRLDNTKKELAL